MKNKIQIISLAALSLAAVVFFNHCSNTDSNSVSTNGDTSQKYTAQSLASLNQVQSLDNNALQEGQNQNATAQSSQSLQLQAVSSVNAPVKVTAADFTNELVASFEANPQDISVLQGEDIALVIGNGAVKEAVDISVTPLSEMTMPAVPAEMQNLTKEHQGYRLLPDGQKFEKDITIALSYDSSQIPFGYTSEDIYTFFYNESLKMWQKVERDSVDEFNHIVYSRTNHFTDYINGILKTPENSDVMAYTPTSIKDLQAANPLEGITMIAPPQANNKGTANLTYPISIPAGRHGMQPDLNITYNSSGGSGWLGLGWDLSISCITVETRWGVPLYDTTLESETYLLDGETLVTGYEDNNELFRLNKPNYRLNWDTIYRNNEYYDGNTIKQFYPRVEGAFRKILRHGTDPRDYWWEIIGKDGTKYFYGGVDGENMDTSSVFRSYVGGKKNIAKWHLAKVIDVYGNTINYHYKYIKTDGYQMLLDYISYTGYDGGEENNIEGDGEGDDEVINNEQYSSREGRYRILFRTADENRLDKSTSYRYGFKESSLKLLDKIQVLYDSDTIKEYYFGYREGGFGKSLLCTVIENAEDSSKYHQYYSVPHFPTNNILQNSVFGRCDFGILESRGDGIYLHVMYSFDYEELPSFILESEARTISYNSASAEDNLYSLFLPINEGKNFNASKSSSWNVGGGVDVGIGYNIFSKALSLGGNYLYTDEDAEGLVTLVDLNGDGYPDKLIKYSNQLKYRLRIPTNDNVIQFGALTPINSPVKKFQYSEGNTDNWGAEGQALSIASFGKNWSDSRNATLVYLADVNADGLVDIIDNGRTYINQYYNTGQITFLDVTDSNTIFIGGSCGDEYIYNDEVVDTSLFSSGYYIIERIVCGTFDEEGIPDTTTYLSTTIDTTWQTITTYDTLRALLKKYFVCLPNGDIDTLYDYYGGNFLRDTIDANGDTLYYSQRGAIWAGGWATTWPGWAWNDERDYIYLNYGCVDASPDSEDYEEVDNENDINHPECDCLNNADTIYYNDLVFYGSDPRFSSSTCNILGGNNYVTGSGCAVIIKPIVSSIMKIDTIIHTTMPDSCWVEVDSVYYQYPERFAPTIDLVRVWVAPYSGTVSISGLAELSADFQDFRRQTNINDGVGIVIQKSDKDTIEKYWTLTTEDSIHDMSVSNIDVTKGDKLYFRMNSMSKREYDKVNWNPTIKYASLTNYDNSRLNDVDGNGDSIFAFNYGNDYSLSQEQKIGAAFKSRFKVQAVITNNEPLKENLVLTINKGYELKYNLCYNPPGEGMGNYYCNDFSISESEELQRYTFNKGTIISETSLDTILYGVILDPSFIQAHHSSGGGESNVTDWDSLITRGNESIFFEMFSANNGQQKWSDIDADITVTIDTSYDSDYNHYDLYDTIEDKYNFVYHPSVNKKAYDYLIMPGRPFVPQNNLTNFNITPVITAPSIPSPIIQSISTVVTIKDASGLVASYSGAGGHTFNGVTLESNKEYYIEYYTQNVLIANSITSIQAKINNTYVDAGLYTNYDTSYDKFGTMYRNWGQFGYNGDTIDNLYIQESLLNLNSNYSEFSESDFPTTEQTMAEESTPETDISGGYNPLLDHFLFMNADPEHNCWTGYGNIVYAAKNYIGHTKVSKANDTLVVDNTTSPLPSVEPGTKIKAVNKYTFTKGKGKTGGVGIPGIVSTGGSSSWGSTRILGDFMDMNGDRYPDVISEKQIQYTKQRGGLSSVVKGNGLIDSSSYEATGETFGASFLKTSFEISNNPKTSKPLLSGDAGAPSVGGNASANVTTATLVDINGDGLPDRLSKNGAVQFNNGYGWENDNYSWEKSIRNGVSSAVSGSVSANVGRKINIAETSIAGGLAMAYSKNETTYALSDINGDGLPDIISNGQVQFNKGRDFTDPITLGAGFDYSHTTSIDGSLAFTIGFTIGPWPVKLEVNPKGGMSWSKTLTEEQWVDMNNDGYPDYIYKDGDNIKVKYSQIGKANLLRHVYSTMGAEYYIDYTLSQSSTECPQRYWNMTSLKVYDGFSGDGEDTMYSTYIYKNRKYDRYERDDYGYDTIITNDYLNNNICRKKTQAFHNDNFMFKGIMKYDLLTNANNSKYVESIYRYVGAEIKTGNIIDTGMAHCFGAAYPVLWKDTTKYYEGGSTPIITAREYAYTKFGNVKEYKDNGNIATTDDNVQANITYLYNTDDGKYLVSMPDTIKISSNGSNVLRKRIGTYTNEGTLATLTLVGNNSNANATYSYTYDNYGNTASVTNPANANNQSMSIYYSYDTVVHTYPDSVSNSLGYYSTAEYNYKYGKPTKTTDMSGNQMRYTYDSKGRVSTILAPKEIEAGKPFTIKYEYWDLTKCIYDPIPVWRDFLGKNTILFAKTTHYDPQAENSTGVNNIEIITFTDGLGRVIQVKKDIDFVGEKRRVNSGWVYYDGLGRKIKQYQLVLDTSAAGVVYTYGRSCVQLKTAYPYLINKKTNDVPPTQIDYDILDRPLKTINPNQTLRVNSYSLDADGFGITAFKASIKDENSNTTNIFTDTRQLKTTIIDPLHHITKFQYDAMGQLAQSIDPENYSTSYQYDMLGRLTLRDHPSAGVTTYNYDKASNMIRQTFSTGEFINYEYDYTRPTAIHYSNRSWNDVFYQYGDVNSTEPNQRGKLVKQQDATGVQTFEYGNMGELIGNTHSYYLPHIYLECMITLTTRWEYDTWNRVRSIQYPNGEKVVYEYNLGGALWSVYEEYGTYYIGNIFYDEFEQRTEVENANGIRTTYSYEPTTRRLSNKTTALHGSASQVTTIQNNKYSYDNVGNITQIDGSGMDNFVQNYAYDNAYRLINADGDWDNGTLGYNLDMSYSAAGRIEHKVMTSSRMNQSGIYNVAYDNLYNYGFNGNPYALERLDKTMTGSIEDFAWDDKGNMTYSNFKDISRYLCWTEDNRLQGMMDNKNTAYYSYDAGGERWLKITGSTHQVNQNGAINFYPKLDKQVLYAGALATVSEQGYTQHYFEEGNRICSRICRGRVPSENNVVLPIDLNGYNLLSRAALKGIESTFDDCMGKSVMVAFDYSKLLYAASTANTRPTFYYHTDHLGSSSYITNDNGQVTQTLAYMPYGESWVDKTSYNPVYTTPHKFNGKELDAESGYSYYGARYYAGNVGVSEDSELGIWLSVDPMAHKYPHLSPYAYCANNPVMLIDPNGMEGIVVSGGEYDGDRYKYNFIEPAITKLKELKAAGGSEPITWAVMTAGYSESDIASFQSVASDLGVGFQAIGSADEFTNYLNSKSVGSSELSKARTGDQITSMAVFGHGYAGSAEFAHGQVNREQFSWSTENAKQLNAGAFNNATVDLYTCNSATNTATGKSLGYVFSQQTGSTVRGYRGQSTYTQMNNGQGFGAKWNRLWNGFNTNGSIRLPQAGQGSTRIKFIPPVR